MSTAVTIGILATAGVLLVIQNLLMVRITASVSTVLVTLVLNSGVGLVLLVAVLTAKGGIGATTEALHTFKPWYLLPGLLGSFFVFASIMGYQRVGAAATIATLVASQLIAGLVADSFRSGDATFRIEPGSLLGAVLLMVGAVLISRGRG